MCVGSRRSSLLYIFVHSGFDAAVCDCSAENLYAMRASARIRNIKNVTSESEYVKRITVISAANRKKYRKFDVVNAERYDPSTGSILVISVSKTTKRNPYFSAFVNVPFAAENFDYAIF